MNRYVLVIILFAILIITPSCFKKDIGDKILGLDQNKQEETKTYDPDEPEIVYYYTKEARYFKSLGDKYLEENNVDRAIDYYEKAISTDPKLHEAYKALGMLNEKLGKNDAALDYYLKSVSFHPNDPLVIYKIGNFYTSKKEYQKAIEYYKLAIKLTPDFSKAYRNLGLAYSLNGNIDQAIESYKLSLSYKDDDYVTYYNLANAYTTKCPFDDNIFNFLKDKPCKLAIEAYETSFSLNPKYTPAYANLASLYQKKGKLDLAKQYYKKALELKPENKAIKKNLAILENKPYEDPDEKPQNKDADTNNLIDGEDLTIDDNEIIKTTDPSNNSSQE